MGEAQGGFGPLKVHPVGDYTCPARTLRAEAPRSWDSIPRGRGLNPGSATS